jgi:hypothetical protein
MPTIGALLHTGKQHLRELAILLVVAVILALLPLAYYGGEVYQNHQDQHLFAPYQYHASAAISGTTGRGGTPEIPGTRGSATPHPTVPH